MLDDAVPARPPVRGGVLVGVIVALAGALALNWNVVLASRGVSHLASATGGLVQPTLVSSAVTALLVGGVLVASGVSLRELGLRCLDLPRALTVLVVVFGALQLAAVIAVLWSGDHLVLARRDAATAVGMLGAQLLGNAPVEEAVFRGLLLRQLLLRARLRDGIGSVVTATAAAAILFALWHIPVRIHEGYRGLDLIASLVIAALGGALVSYVYVRSGNLLIVVVLHGLFNDPLTFVVSPLSPQSPQWILCGLAIGVIVWIERAARRGAARRAAKSSQARAR
jgi:CAAX protease family protein